MSIYLLKPNVSVDNALKDDHDYKEAALSGAAIAGARIFLKAGHENAPWWKGFLGIEDDVSQQSSSATAFIPCGDRMMVLTFGAGLHLLRDDAFEHDFGTRVVLNAVDPNKLKSTDTLDPDSSQRRRTQIPFDGDLALLSFTSDTSVLKSLTGKAKAEYSDLVHSVTGSDSLRITTPTRPGDFPLLLDNLYRLYESQDYLTTFPDIAQMQPVTDPAVIDPLNVKLVAAVFDTAAPIILTVPDVLDYRDEAYVQFAGRGTSDAFEDVYIKHYREYLVSAGASASTLTIEDLRHDSLLLLNGAFELSKRWSVFRSLIFETPGEDDYTYHLSDGTWYKVASGLVESLRVFLEPYWVDANLPNHQWANEGEYNTEASALIGGLCLDKTNISPDPKYPVEPCDILRVTDGAVDLVHVKMGTTSSTLSHLFNQAANSVQLLLTDDDATAMLVDLVRARADNVVSARVEDAVKNARFSITLAIVSHKQTPELKSDNLPIFSRISLKRVLVALRAMRIPVTVQLVPDDTNSAGRKKPRKPRQAARQ